jgi:L-amino acid N-acyltransferase
MLDFVQKDRPALMIRKSTPADIEAITEIYNESIREGGFTGDLRPLSVEDRRIWYAEHQEKYSIFVKVVTGSVVGYVALSPYRKGREAFAQSCEINYYLLKRYRGFGFGREMIEYAIEEAIKLDFHVIVAMILSINERSIKLLQKFDFSVSGIIPRAAKIGEKPIDHVYLYRQLGESESS